jgi:hypothetical protein
MAFAEVETIIANSGRKRMARHLTAKQIKHFGTKRQKAALKASRSRKRTAKRTNRGHSKRRAKTSHRPRTKPSAPRRKNPMEIISLLPSGNPAHKRRKAVAATHSRKRKRKSSASGHRRKNAGRRAKPRFSRHRRGNPGKIGGWLTAGLSVIGGAVISKVATQFALGAKNTGFMGYGGNAVATAVLGFAAHKLFRDKLVGQMVVAGGIAQIIVRMISDYTPYGQYLAGTGLGDYMVANWVAPQRLPDALSSAMVEIPNGWAPTTVMQSAAAGAGVGDLYGAPLY